MKIDKSKFYQKSARIIILFLFIAGVSVPTMLLGQAPELLNSAERGQPWISAVNPAVLSFQDARVSMGLKAFQFGFLPGQALELRESHINLSLPFYLPYELGIGADLRYYSAGIYSEVQGALMLSRRMFDQFSVGLKLGLIGTGFSRHDFNLVDANDPLINDNLWKNSLNVGLGAFWSPGHWSVGLGFDHLNQPDLGLHSQAKLPLDISASLGYRFRHFMPTLLIQDDGVSLRYGLAFSLIHQNMGLVRFSYENDVPFKLEAQLNLTRNSSLQYGLDLPSETVRSVSLGTHELVYTYTFEREPDIGQPEILLSTRQLKILEETIIRSMPSNLTLAAVENSEEVAAEYLDNQIHLQNSLVVKAGALLDQAETPPEQRQRHVHLGSTIQQVLKNNPDLRVILHTDESSLTDARQLKNYLITENIVSPAKIGIAKLKISDQANLVGFIPGQEVKTNESPRLSTADLKLNFKVPGRTRRLKTWKLVIQNKDKQVVKTYQGNGSLPDKLVWDWKNDQGQLTPPGEYHSFLTVQALSGKSKTSQSPQFNIVCHKRTVKLEFKPTPQKLITSLDAAKN